MKTREDCLKMKPENGNRNREKLVTFKAFSKFVEAIDIYWKKNGYQNRTRFIFGVIAKKIKWKGDF